MEGCRRERTADHMAKEILAGRVHKKDGGREMHIVVRDTDTDCQLARLVKPVKNDPNVPWFYEANGQRQSLDEPTLKKALDRLVEDYDDVINNLPD